MNEPYCPPGRRPHSERVKDVEKLLKKGQSAALCIDDTPEHKAWYAQELAKYPSLKIATQSVLSPGVYMFKVEKCQ